MKKFIKALSLGALLAVSATSAMAATDTAPTMQHYVFTYDFNNTVDPISPLAAQTAKEIEHMLVVEVQKQAHNNLSLMLTDDAMQDQFLLASTDHAMLSAQVSE